MRWASLALVILLVGCLDAPAPGDDAATFEAAPVWEIGDWWTYEYVKTGRSGLTDTFTIVVAAETATHYLVGMPDEHFSDLALIYHTPPIGEVRKSDLMWDPHDTPLEWLRFPITEGDEWTTNWWGTPDIPIWVDSVTDEHAVVGLFARDAPMKYVYDLEAQNMARWPSETDEEAEAAFQDLRLRDWGHGYQGDVRVPEGQDLVLYHGVSLGANVVPGSMTPGLGGTPYTAPTEIITVPEGYDAMTSAILLGPTLLPNGDWTPAAAGMRVTAPDGTVFEDRITPGDDHTILLWHHGDPAGDWSYVADTPGGYAILEAIAYREVVYSLGASA